MITSSHHQCQLNPLPDLPSAAGAPGAVPLGTSIPDSDPASSGGLVLKELVALLNEISPPLKVCVTVSPSTFCLAGWHAECAGRPAELGPGGVDGTAHHDRRRCRVSRR